MIEAVDVLNAPAALARSARPEIVTAPAPKAPPAAPVQRAEQVAVIAPREFAHLPTGGRALSGSAAVEFARAAIAEHKAAQAAVQAVIYSASGAGGPGITGTAETEHDGALLGLSEDELMLLLELLED